MRSFLAKKGSAIESSDRLKPNDGLFERKSVPSALICAMTTARFDLEILDRLDHRPHLALRALPTAVVS